MADDIGSECKENSSNTPTQSNHNDREVHVVLPIGCIGEQEAPGATKKADGKHFTDLEGANAALVEENGKKIETIFIEPLCSGNTGITNLGIECPPDVADDEQEEDMDVVGNFGDIEEKSDEGRNNETQDTNNI